MIRKYSGIRLGESHTEVWVTEDGRADRRLPNVMCFAAFPTSLYDWGHGETWGALQLSADLLADALGNDTLALWMVALFAADVLGPMPLGPWNMTQMRVVNEAARICEMRDSEKRYTREVADGQ